VPHDVRDLVVDFVRRWSEKAEIGVGRFIPWLGVTASKFYDWRQRYGCVNEHNGWVPRDFWLELWEKEAIIGFHLKNPLEELSPSAAVPYTTWAKTPRRFWNSFLRAFM
jgi:putative transposase